MYSSLYSCCIILCILFIQSHSPTILALCGLCVYSSSTCQQTQTSQLPFVFCYNFSYIYIICTFCKALFIRLLYMENTLQIRLLIMHFLHLQPCTTLYLPVTRYSFESFDELYKWHWWAYNTHTHIYIKRGMMQRHYNLLLRTIKLMRKSLLYRIFRG